MAEDLRRFLESEPIAARRVSARERVFRWARRRPGQAALAGGLVAMTVLAFAGITSLWVAASAARDQARAADAAERRARYQAAIAAAAGALELNDLDAASALLDSAPEEHRNWEWRYIAAQLDGVRTTFLPADGPVSVFALAPDGRTIAYAVAGGRDVRIRAPGAAADTAVFRGHEAAVELIAFSPDGKLVASGSLDRTVRVWEVASGRPVAVLTGHRGVLARLVFSGDGSRLVTGSAEATNDLSVLDDGCARVWDVAEGRLLAEFPGFESQFSPDGRSVIARSGWQMALARSRDRRRASQPDPARSGSSLGGL